MGSVRSLVIVLVCTVLTYFQALWSIEAGVARISITPETGLNMVGFGPRESTGVDDSLYVRVVVFRSGPRCVGLVVHDLCMPLGRNLQDDLRSRIRQSTKIENVFFHVTHTHSGPEVKDGLIDDLREYEKIICRKTIAAVQKAYEGLQPVKIGAGTGAVDLSYERHVAYADGSVKNMWENHHKIAHGPVDKTVKVIKVDDMQGRPLAVLVNYACHPVIYGYTRTVYSPDYPGVLCVQVQSRVENNPVCIFFQGCAGNINPYFANALEPKQRTVETGEALADEVLDVMQYITTKPYTGDLSVVSDMLEIESGLRYDLGKWKPADKAEVNRKKSIQRFADGNPDFKLPLGIVLITPEIGFVCLPGEPYVKHQQNIRFQSPVRHLFVTGYTGMSCGYLPTISGAVMGGYGGNDLVTFTEVGTGEKMVVEAVVNMYKLLGMLSPTPARENKGYIINVPNRGMGEKPSPSGEDFGMPRRGK